MSNEGTVKASLSKKRYAEIRDAYLELMDKEQVDKCMAIMCEVTKFDPNGKTYTKERAIYLRAYRDKLKEEGISTYVSSGMKAAYHKRKAASTST